ncbi:MAG: Nif3-like dinuclear metal center hexameric protein, partial [Ruminococcus sp.]|nr:Nif3-like dinuclear metal center hexameric protein [Ruminococcus sp.]
MAKVLDIYRLIDGFAPFDLQEDYDNSGLVVGGYQSEVKRVLLALDITNSVADEAVQKGYDLVISHHPVIFNGLKLLSPQNPAVILATNGINALCIHTNFDIANGGMNDLLCERLGLTPTE